MGRFPETTFASSRCDRDEDGYPDVLVEELEACLYCGRKGGTPFAIIGDETHCTRCFEDFTEAEFAEYLEEAGAGSVMRQGPATRIGVGASLSVVQGHDAVSEAVVMTCGNCTQTAERLTESPDDENFLLCDTCMEEAVEIEAKKQAERAKRKRIATERMLTAVFEGVA